MLRKKSDFDEAGTPASEMKAAVEQRSFANSSEGRAHLASEELASVPRLLLRNAVDGSAVWFVYGAVELILSCFAIGWFHPDIQLQQWQWGLVLSLWAVYVVSGFLTGFLGGVILWRTGILGRQGAARWVSSLTLALAFIANLVRFRRTLAVSEDLALLIALALCVVFIFGLASENGRSRWRFLANPWAVSLLLLGGPWSSREAWFDGSIFAKLGLFALLAIGAVIVAALWERFRPSLVSMVRHPAAIAAGMGLILLGAVSAQPSGDAPLSKQPGRPNVLLITMDTVRADHLSVYGYDRETSPELARLARESTLYRRAIAVSDFTLPTHASIFTGLYPSWHGAYYSPPDNPAGRPLGRGARTLAETLSMNGYWTGGVVANHAYLHPYFGLNRGFEAYDYRRPVELLAHDRPFYLRNAALGVVRRVEDISAMASPTLRATDINRRALQMLEERGNKSFFLFLNYMDAHTPFAAPPPFDSRFPGKDPGFRPAADRTVEDAVYSAVLTGKRSLTPAERAHFISQYDGGIAYVDSQIGALLSRLRELNLYDNTLIIVTSDHGNAFGEHELIDHGNGFVYQDQVHVPLIVKYPHQSDAKVSDALATQVDLMPTILEQTGAQPMPNLQGRSLSKPRTEDSDVIYAEARAPRRWAAANSRLRGIRRAIFSGSLELISWSLGPSQLYDLQTDPQEAHNVFDENDPRIRALLDKLTAWTASAPRQLEQAPKLDKGAAERLKSLGYVQ